MRFVINPAQGGIACIPKRKSIVLYHVFDACLAEIAYPIVCDKKREWRLNLAPTAPVFIRGYMNVKSEVERQLEAQLLTQVAKGDQLAFAQIYDRFSPGLYSMALRMVNDASEAEDVLQETFSQIWQKASTYDAARSSAFTWAVMILRHKAIDRLRVRKRLQRTTDKAIDLDFFPSVDETSAAQPLQRELHQRVRAALDQIPDDQKQAIGLAFFTELTHEEIAAQLNQPLGTVKARIRRGLLRLRDFVKEGL
jgi:RNA polymerase sigma-70 factor (ECF subfamily)